MSRPSQSRFMLRYLTPALLLSLLAAVVLVTGWVTLQREALVREGEAAARQLAVLARQAVAAEAPALLNVGANSVLASHRVAAIGVVDAEGVELGRYRRELQPVAAGSDLTLFMLQRLLSVGLERTQRVALTPPGAADAPLGWVSIELAVDEHARAELAAFRAVLGAAVSLVLLALLSAAWFARRRRLAMAALCSALARMQQGDLQARVRVPVGGVLRDIANELNEMAQALNMAQLELEQKVEQTTSELRQTLEAVEIQNVELDLARKRALEASKVKSEFLANMSHEIRTPINGILGFADLLAHSPLDEEQRDYVNTVKDSCANLLTIVNDILDFSKIEAGKLAIDSVAFDLRDSVEEVLSLLAPTAYGKALELLHLIYADVPLKLYGDPIRIRQVLTNLVHNAIKFTPAGRVVVRVMLEDESDQDALLRVTVTDTGIGLSEEDQAKLFTAFGQADTSITRRFGGAGLGLIISRKLVEQMGGAIGFESEPGQGSTFWFTLRCLKQRTPQHASPEPADNPLVGCRVLIYDEDGLSRLALKHVLEAWNMQVTEVDERQRFISLVAAQSRWDLVIIGLNRSELNARTFHGLMPRLQHIQLPILVLASTVDRNELRSVYQQGARAALPKALRRQTLYREICRLYAEDKGGPVSSPASLPAPPKQERGRERKDLLVLVVDDNQINRKLVSTILGIHGASVLEAEDGKQAVEIAAEHPVDLIFMDIHMPTMSGETAAREIQAQTDKAKTPRIVALTANAMPGERERLLAGGMDDCLIKPISEEQVAEILAELRKEAGLVAEEPRAREDEIPVEAAAPVTSQRRPPMLAELQEMLRAELPSHKRAIQQAYRANRHKELKDSVHKLHGAASVCRAEPLRAACAELENALGRDDLVVVPGGVRRLMEEIDQLLDRQACSSAG